MQTNDTSYMVHTCQHFNVGQLRVPHSIMHTHQHTIKDFTHIFPYFQAAQPSHRDNSPIGHGVSWIRRIILKVSSCALGDGCLVPYVFGVLLFLGDLLC